MEDLIDFKEKVNDFNQKANWRFKENHILMGRRQRGWTNLNKVSKNRPSKENCCLNTKVSHSLWKSSMDV